MSFINRQLENIIRAQKKGFPIITITGPRQSGKSTLAKKMFPEKPYVSLEEPDILNRAIEDPRGFLAQYSNGAIFDEAQRAPDLFSYLQGIVDAKPESGLFILTGSQNFLLLKSISQSLAGRVRILSLLPFSWQELNSLKPNSTIEEMLFLGMYPPIHDRDLSPTAWYSDYVTTYVERDARTIVGISDLRLFHKFLMMCAARSGQLLNLTSLGNDCGISNHTASSWLSILEASYIVFLLPPHHKNFNKRLVKSPKLYFHDTGLLCSLLGIKSPADIFNSSFRGALFETFVMSEFMKHQTNLGERPELYFWRDKTGHEIDCVIDRGESAIPVEIKSGKTIAADFFKDLEYWKRLSNRADVTPFLIYAGDDDHTQRDTRVLGWKSLSSTFD